MKRRYLHKSRGQSTAEYAVLLAIVATALIAMQVYLKRGIQGRIRDLATQLAPGASDRQAQQYEAGNTTSEFTTRQVGQTSQIYQGGVSNITQNEIINRSGWEHVSTDTQSNLQQP